MINKPEIYNNRNLAANSFSERVARLLFIKNFINENFGEGKFYSKIKTYGIGSFYIE